MKNHSRLLRSIAFLLLLAAVVYESKWIFGVSDQDIYNNRTGFLSEDRESLDGIYIGGSDVYYFWQPLFGWMDHGIAIWNYCANSMKSTAIKFFLAETMKRQPNALYIININAFKYENTLKNTYTNIHRAVDYMPLSLNTLKLTHELTKRSDYNGLDRLEFYLPLIRFHSGWDRLQPWVFGTSDVDYKASLRDRSFFISKDVSDVYTVYDDSKPLSDDVKQILEDLLDYCDEYQVNVLFVKVPQSSTNKTLQGRMNTVQSIVTERGYPFLDLFDKVSEMGIDMREEYYDEKHTNVHGSLKFSKVLGDYLVENYGFEDKRGLREWADWDESAAQYADLTSQYTLDFEREHAQREITEIPTLSTPAVSGQNITVKWKWNSEEDIDGFVIYRKCTTGDDLVWHEVAEVGSADRQWKDEGLQSLTQYTYTVVPYRMVDGSTVYGSFKVNGVSAKTKE